MTFKKAMPWGGAIGFFSGIIGVGGGIFLSPILLLKGWATPKTAAPKKYSLYFPFETSSAFFTLNEIKRIAKMNSFEAFANKILSENEICRII